MIASNVETNLENPEFYTIHKSLKNQRNRGNASSVKRSDIDRKPKDLTTLGRYVRNIDKTSLSKYQHGTNRHKHRKHHHRYRQHTRRKKNNFRKLTTPTEIKEDIGRSFALRNKSVGEETQKVGTPSKNENFEKLNRKEVKQRKLIQSIIDSFYGEVYASKSNNFTLAKLDSKSNTPAWLVRDLRRDNEYLNENKSLKKFSVVAKNKTLTTSKSSKTKKKEWSEQVSQNLNSAKEREEYFLNKKPFVIPDKLEPWTIISKNNSHSSPSLKFPLLYESLMKPNASFITFHNESKNESLNSKSVDNIKKFGEWDLDTTNEAAKLHLQDEPTAVNPSGKSNKPRNDPLNIIAIKENKEKNIRIRKSNEHVSSSNRTSPHSLPRYSPFRSSHQFNETRNELIRPINCLNQLPFRTQKHKFPVAIEPNAEGVHANNQHEPCYSIRDLFLVILITSLVNLMAGIVIIFAFCCLPLRECCFFAYTSRLSHHNQGGFPRNLPEEDIR